MLELSWRREAIFQRFMDSAQNCVIPMQSHIYLCTNKFLCYNVRNRFMLCSNSMYIQVNDQHQFLFIMASRGSVKNISVRLFLLLQSNNIGFSVVIILCNSLLFISALSLIKQPICDLSHKTSLKWQQISPRGRNSHWGSIWMIFIFWQNYSLESDLNLAWVYLLRSYIFF